MAFSVPGNKLTGSIPEWLGLLTSLSTFQYVQSFFNSTTVPDTYLVALLNMEMNMLNGTIPESLTNIPLGKCHILLHWLLQISYSMVHHDLHLAFIESVRLAQNNLFGSLPSGFGVRGPIGKCKSNPCVCATFSGFKFFLTCLSIVVCLDIRSTMITGEISSQVCSAQNESTSLYVPCGVRCSPDSCCSCNLTATLSCT